MCIAGLNVSTGACQHRWYELVSPCNPISNLANCSERLRLQGWEVRKDNCPFCDGENHHRSTHRLFGSTSSASSITSSPTISEIGVTPATRRGSMVTLNLNAGQLSPISRTISGCSIETERSRRNRDMNDRIRLYLSSEPHEVLPSARKNYPTYAAAVARVESGLAGKDQSDNAYTRLRRRSSVSSVGQGWKRFSERFGLINSSLHRIDQ
ncbi:hypothetical protein DOTSEDRAFT_73866 [Dothistroma septosporum NZE10]|uniref:Uncharacterized protein n=1 Tax=Dothistroma septosporum (strain NZE10 / CBS 128990) TaxID=675120 RepID=N1PHG4_DOTSN|nr:hypothetical protein DOTSEDRAFT_73866 [Dothistroma septosporum NZE10]